MVLATRGLTKRYRDRVAVRDLDLAVARGDIYGFLGPNGAGKTTTIRMLVGLIRPTAGEVRLFGEALTAQRRGALARVGAIVETPSLYGYLSGKDNLRLFADLTGPCAPGRIDEVLARVGLAERAADPVSIYSHGMKQRLAIAAALLPRPELILLDEPTNGLDPMGIRDVRELIRSLARDDGLTVFVSSHLLAEIEQLCSRGCILVGGVKQWEGEVGELLASRRRLRLRASPTERVAAVLAEVAPTAVVERSPGGAGVAAGVPAGGVRVADTGWRIAGEVDAAELVARLVAAGCRVSEIVSEVPTLEEVFLELVAARGGGEVA